MGCNGSIQVHEKEHGHLVFKIVPDNDIWFFK